LTHLKKQHPKTPLTSNKADVPYARDGTSGISLGSGG
jgi:hypothetical protein